MLLALLLVACLWLASTVYLIGLLNHAREDVERLRRRDRLDRPAIRVRPLPRRSELRR